MREMRYATVENISSTTRLDGRFNRKSFAFSHNAMRYEHVSMSGPGKKSNLISIKRHFYGETSFCAFMFSAVLCAASSKQVERDVFRKRLA